MQSGLTSAQYFNTYFIPCMEACNGFLQTKHITFRYPWMCTNLLLAYIHWL